MSAALHLAAPEDAPKLLPMIEAFHGEEGVTGTPASRADAVSPLLAGSPHGAIWLIGPRAAPVGYIVISFGWSVASGGLIGFIDEFFIRDSIRGRGMGTEVLIALSKELGASGVTGLRLEVATDNDRASALYQRLGFKPRDNYRTMSWSGRNTG